MMVRNGTLAVYDNPILHIKFFLEAILNAANERVFIYIINIRFETKCILNIRLTIGMLLNRLPSLFVHTCNKQGIFTRFVFPIGHSYECNNLNALNYIIR